jgi:hypothetical protein
MCVSRAPDQRTHTARLKSSITLFLPLPALDEERLLGFRCTRVMPKQKVVNGLDLICF